MNDIKVTTEIKTREVIRLGFEDVLAYLKHSCLVPDKYDKLRIFTVCPSGGDYSGMNLDIDKDNPIFVEITATKITESSKEI
jgi:hypothetical protein